MEIKTTSNIVNDSIIESKIGWDFRLGTELNKRWVAVDDVIKEIMSKAAFGNPNDREKIMKSLSTTEAKLPKHNNDFIKPCSRCGGNGNIRSVISILDGYDLDTCPDCDGQGFIKS